MRDTVQFGELEFVAGQENKRSAGISILCIVHNVGGRGRIIGIAGHGYSGTVRNVLKHQTK